MKLYRVGKSELKTPFLCPACGRRHTWKETLAGAAGHGTASCVFRLQDLAPPCGAKVDRHWEDLLEPWRDLTAEELYARHVQASARARQTSL
ncbi:MAG TPA: hypothetical protein VIL08_04515 [Limnochorda sp.]